VSLFYTNLFVVSLDQRIKLSDNFESLGQAKSNSRCHSRTLVTVSKHTTYPPPPDTHTHTHTLRYHLRKNTLSITSKVPSSLESSAQLRLLTAAPYDECRTISTCTLPIVNCNYEHQTHTILYLCAKFQLHISCTVLPEISLSHGTSVPLYCTYMCFTYCQHYLLGISLPPYSTYKQSFNLGSVVLSEISLDKKAWSIIQPSHTPSQPSTNLISWIWHATTSAVLREKVKIRLRAVLCSANASDQIVSMCVCHQAV